MAIWDYEGKLASSGWSRDHCLQILQARLLSPPGKMLRAFVQAVCNAILLKFYSGAEQPPDPICRMTMKGVTSQVPFSPLEAKVTTRVSAAQTDFAEVDLTAWSSPSDGGGGSCPSHTPTVRHALVGRLPCKGCYVVVAIEWPRPPGLSGNRGLSILCPGHFLLALASRVAYFLLKIPQRILAYHARRYPLLSFC
jgi:hypothetical protein